MLIQDSQRSRPPSTGHGQNFGAATADRGPLETPGSAAQRRSDSGTIFLHWATAVAFIAALLTGIRVAADALDAPVSKLLSPLLPQGEVWTWHFAAGLALFFCTIAYVFYTLRAALAPRNSLKQARVLLMPATRPRKWGAINILLHWFAYVLVFVLTVTGVILYLGYGGWWVVIHSTAAFVGLSFVPLHILAHFAYGGWQQLLRLFRPAPLVRTVQSRSKPLLIGCLGGAFAVILVAAADWSSRDTLLVSRTAEVPQLDGELDDSVWQRIKPVVIHTHQGANLGGTGTSVVEVRAVHDGTNIYFAFRWTDPTRSLRRVPLIKKEDGWYLSDPDADRMDVNAFYEDKLAVIFSEQSSLGGGGVTRLGADPLGAGYPRPLNGRGFHYTVDGSFVDLWQWKASRGGSLGYVDDQYMGPPYAPNEKERSYDARYQGGYTNDPGTAFYSYNFSFVRKGAGHRAVTPIRLPKDLNQQVAALGKFDLDPDSSDAANGRWYMFEAESAPYSKEADARIPVGTVLPGVLISGSYTGDRADLRGAARWRDGHWTLETSRALITGSPYDKAFLLERPLYMWVAVFDHTQTRHTRHPRPVRVLLTE